MVSNLFCICVEKDGSKNCERKPYAIEQLHVCTLLTNYYIYLNGNIVGSNNTFGLSPPRLSEYPRL